MINPRSVNMDSKIDYSMILNKPIPSGNLTWTTSATTFQIIAQLSSPASFTNNPLILKPYESTALYRQRSCLLLQVSGTARHSGTLIVASVPFGTAEYFRKLGLTNRQILPTMLAAPHVFLSANESTSVCLEIPFYSQTDLIRTDVNNKVSNVSSAQHAEIFFMVLNPLSAPTSGSTSLTISMHYMIREADFFIPKVEEVYIAQSSIVSSTIDGIVKVVKKKSEDVIDAGREIIKAYTGLHNPNVPFIQQRVINSSTNMLQYVDTPSFLFKLDPYANFTRDDKELVFHTDIDEMSITNICKKPAYLGTFTVNTSDAAGKVLWSRPITPFQTTVYNSTGQQKQLCTPMEILGSLAKVWRGGLKIHIQSSMSNFHFCKLLVVRNYSTNKDQGLLVPNFYSVGNLLSDTLEFSAGGQVHTLCMSFNSPSTELNCCPFDAVTNAFQHGMYYIYLYQPLVGDGSVSSSIKFNVYISAGDEFGFAGYPLDNTMFLAQSKVVKNKFWKKGSEKTQECDDKPEVPMKVQPVQVDNRLIGNYPEIDAFSKRFRPILSVRDILRRITPAYTFALTSTSGTPAFAHIKISEIIGLKGLGGATAARSVFQDIFNLFEGFKGGLKFRVRSFATTADAAYTVSFIPPQQLISYRPVDPPLGGVPDYISVMKSSGSDPGSSAMQAVCRSTFLNEYDTTQPTPLGRYRAVTKLFPDYLFNSNSRNQVSEFEIPYMNVLNYVGSLSTRLETSADFYSTDLGSLLFFVDTSGATAEVSFKIEVGLADEARLGHQVICVPVQLKNMDGTYNGITTMRVMGNHMFSGSETDYPTTPTIPNVDPTPVVGACYITA